VDLGLLTNTYKVHIFLGEIGFRKAIWQIGFVRWQIQVSIKYKW